MKQFIESSYDAKQERFFLKYSYKGILIKLVFSIKVSFEGQKISQFQEVLNFFSLIMKGLLSRSETIFWVSGNNLWNVNLFQNLFG